MRLLPLSISQRQFFGLSLNAQAIRAVFLTSEQKVQSSYEAISPSPIFHQGQINKPALAETFKLLFSQFDYSLIPFVAVSLPEHYSYNRTHTLPKLPLEDVTEALSWQIEKIFPIPKQRIYFDWHLIEEQTNNLQIQIVAISKNIIDDIVAQLGTYNVRPVGFEPAASALTRLVPGDQSTVILIDVNPHGSCVSLILDHYLTMTITNHFPLQQNDQNTQTALQSTVQSIQSLQNYFQKQISSQETTPSFLLTGDSAADQLSSWFTQVLNQKVELLGVTGVEPKFHQSFAAAKTKPGTSSVGRSINLLPEQLLAVYQSAKQHRQTITKIKYSFISLGFSLILLVITLLFCVTKLYQSQKEMAVLETNGQAIPYNTTELSRANFASRTITKLFPVKTLPVTTLEEISSLQKSSITITNFTYEKANKKIKLNGIAENRENLLTFRHGLTQIETIADVQVPLSSLDEPEDVKFVINITLK